MPLNCGNATLSSYRESSADCREPSATYNASCRVVLGAALADMTSHAGLTATAIMDVMPARSPNSKARQEPHMIVATAISRFSIPRK